MNEIEESYFNAYLLFTEQITYDELAEEGMFYLPKDHGNPKVLLEYFEEIEDYEKCNDIIESI